MFKGKWLLMALLACLLIACDGTYVTKNSIDSEVYSFPHAGKNYTILVELKEIRTMTRRNGIFHIGPTEKSVTYAYGLFVSVPSQQGMTEVFVKPASKKTKVSDFLAKIRIKKSKDRKHIALFADNETIVIYHSFKKVLFPAEYPLDPKGFAKKEITQVDLEDMETPREALKKHISRQKNYLITDKQLYTMLKQLPPQDELNHELSYSIGDNQLFQEKTYYTAIINHCKKDENWRKNALKTIKNKRENTSDEEYISKLHAIGGMKEVAKEDQYQLKLYYSTGSLNYFVSRLEKGDVLLPSKIKSELKAHIQSELDKGARMNATSLANLKQSFDVAQKVGIKNPFDRFFIQLKKQKISGEQLHSLNGALMFPSSILGESDKREWVAYMVEHFGKMDAFDQRWDYSSLEDDLTCEQKKYLLTNYAKTINEDGEKQIPDCH